MGLSGLKPGREMALGFIFGFRICIHSKTEKRKNLFRHVIPFMTAGSVTVIGAQSGTDKLKF